MVAAIQFSILRPTCYMKRTLGLTAAAGRAPTRPKPPSKAALRRRLREAEA